LLSVLYFSLLRISVTSILFVSVLCIIVFEPSNLPYVENLHSLAGCCVDCSAFDNILSGPTARGWLCVFALVLYLGLVGLSIHLELSAVMF
jgi:hypothetical protein